jgi:hypothetical protein
MSDEVVKLPSRNVTIVGSFNPAIFHPEWVRAHLVEPEGSIDLLFPAPGGAPLLRAGDLYLSVGHQRLVVYGPLVAAADVAARILHTLPHTPLQAAGINLQFQGRCERRAFGPWHLESDAERTRELLMAQPAGQTFTQLSRRDDGVQLTLKLTWPSEHDDVLLDLNYHLDGTASQEKRALQLAEHVKHAPTFEQDAERIGRVLLLG